MQKHKQTAKKLFDEIKISFLTASMLRRKVGTSECIVAPFSGIPECNSVWLCFSSWPPTFKINDVIKAKCQLVMDVDFGWYYSFMHRKYKSRHLI